MAFTDSLGQARTGTYSAPSPTYTAAANVRYGTDRGDGVTGTLRVPTPSQVLSGVAVDDTSGNVTLPTAGDVRVGTQYGVSGTGTTGTLQVTTGGGGSGLTTEQAAAIALLPGINATLGSTTVQVQAPVATVDGKITLVVGDDYKAADGRALSFTVVGGPSLVGGTSALIIGGASLPGTVVDATHVRVELTAAQTAALGKALQPGNQITVPYLLRATLADGDSVTVARGSALVTA